MYIINAENHVTKTGYLHKTTVDEVFITGYFAFFLLLVETYLSTICSQLVALLQHDDLLIEHH